MTAPRYDDTPRALRPARRILAACGALLVLTACGNGMEAEPVTPDGRIMEMDETPPPCVLVREWTTGFMGTQTTQYAKTYCLPEPTETEEP